MRILVTGGAGFIGSNFIRYWLKKYPKNRIVNLDKLTYAGHLSSTSDFCDSKNYKFVKGDICNTQLVDKITQEIDWVVHFAAESHVDRSISGPQVFIKTNIIGTQVLLDASIRNKIKRFHHVSTDEVFGELPLHSKNKFDENTLYDPRSPYSASKASSDHLVRAYHYTYGLNTSITNCSNNFGSYQHPEKFLPRMITNLIDNNSLPVYGDGKYVRDWLYVDDHIAAIEKVLFKGISGCTYLVGGQKKDVTNLDIAKKLIKIFGKSDKVIKFVTDRKGHDRRYAVDWGKINKELGWEPKYDFDNWLVKTVSWYKENEWWWRPLKNQAELLYKSTKQR